MKTEIILKEGYPFIFVSGGLFFISLVFKFALFWQILFFVFFAFFVFFFRNPERVPEDTSKGAVISPSDGEIIEIVETKAPLTGENMIKISIKLSLFDVHVQRSPIEGEITAKEYIHGLFLSLSDKKASELNEQNRVLFSNASKVVVNQIAGFITRRIVDFGKFGRVSLGERYGMIMFGSQVDLYLPKNTKIKVTEFQKVKAGESLIGFLNES
ncbi:phosphatidylserine decarboxylase family protein [Nautilia sp. PV-1]|jgi:phosphatidylserine decarboxylase|uniref:phosphatidylserine decarboxylase n=1 Tax=Nautilia sp. PV-1 TaxID=2579250 RepID=UPI000FD7231C|nr:phosphatidylserine decarboxylase [Nautilia sp. PV-1]AZV45841.1 phosphatidylserine decarboxylase family protein [Nautilia sp. PV-1]